MNTRAFDPKELAAITLSEEMCAADIKAVLAKYEMEFHVVEVRVDGKVQSLEMKLFKKLPK